MSSVPQTPRRGRCCSPVDAGVEKISPSAAVPHVPASSIGSASLAFIPAFDFSPIYPVGLVAHSDGHRVREGKQSCPTRDGSGSTQDGALVP